MNLSEFKLVKVHSSIGHSLFCDQLNLEFFSHSGTISNHNNLDELIKDRTNPISAYFNGEKVLSTDEYWASARGQMIEECTWDAERQWFIEKINPYLVKKIMNES